MAFQGYLLKTTSGNYIFPLQFINWASWSTTPNQREEIKAYRNENTRNLVRVTAQGTKTSISFTTKPLTLAEKKVVQKFFTDHESNALERKIQLTYWNDESNSYQTGYFYRPDITFTIRKIDTVRNDIVYEPFTVELIEY